MAKVIIEIEIGNAAFEDDYEGEMEKVMDEIADLVIEDQTDGVLYDSNGNAIGEVTFSGDDDNGE